MHPLADNLKSLSFEDLEKRSSEILRRMQLLRRNNLVNPEIWDQLNLFLDSINNEKMERALLLNNRDKDTNVVVNTDPLDEEKQVETKQVNKGFSPIT